MSQWGLNVIVNSTGEREKASPKSNLFLIGVFRGLSMDDSAWIEEKLRRIETPQSKTQFEFRWQRCGAKSLEMLDGDCRATGLVLRLNEWVEFCRSIRVEFAKYSISNANDSAGSAWRRWQNPFPVTLACTGQRSFFDPSSAEMFVGLSDNSDDFQLYETTPILYRHDENYWSLVTINNSTNKSAGWNATFEKVLDDDQAVRWLFENGIVLPPGLEKNKRRVTLDPYKYPQVDSICVMDESDQFDSAFATSNVSKNSGNMIGTV